jgi:hypothetical protein
VVSDLPGPKDDVKVRCAHEGGDRE